jgi:hypothetical protein
MYKLSSIVLSVILLITLNTACSEDVNSSNNESQISETQAVQKAQKTNPGSVTKQN